MVGDHTCGEVVQNPGMEAGSGPILGLARIGGRSQPLVGSGATVAQLTLDQKVEGSNPSSPANKILWSDVTRIRYVDRYSGFVCRAQTPGCRVIRISDVLSDPIEWE